MVTQHNPPQQPTPDPDAGDDPTPPPSSPPRGGDDSAYFEHRFDELLAQAQASSPAVRLASFRSLAALESRVNAGKRLARAAARERLSERVRLAVAQGELCCQVVLTATSRAACMAELSAFLATQTTKSAEVASGNLIATSLAWTRLVEIRPGVEQELLDERFMLSDFRDVARASIRVSLKRGEDGHLLPPSTRIVRDDDFNIAGAVDAAVEKGALRRLKRQEDRLARLERQQDAADAAAAAREPDGESDGAGSGSGSGSGGGGERRSSLSLSASANEAYGQGQHVHQGDVEMSEEEEEEEEEEPPRQRARRIEDEAPTTAARSDPPRPDNAPPPPLPPPPPQQLPPPPQQQQQQARVDAAHNGPRRSSSPAPASSPAGSPPLPSRPPLLGLLPPLDLPSLPQLLRPQDPPPRPHRNAETDHRDVDSDGWLNIGLATDDLPNVPEGPPGPAAGNAGASTAAGAAAALAAAAAAEVAAAGAAAEAAEAAEVARAGEGAAPAAPAPRDLLSAPLRPVSSPPPNAADDDTDDNDNGDDDTTTRTASLSSDADQEGGGGWRRNARFKVRVAAGDELSALEDMTAPLVLAHARREFGARVVNVDVDGEVRPRLEVAATPAIARCLAKVGRMLRKLFGDGCEDANARAVDNHAGLLALGLGGAFSSAMRIVRGGGGGGGEDGGGSSGGGDDAGGAGGTAGGNNSSGGGGAGNNNSNDTSSADRARAMADDAAPECAALVVWLDPEIVANNDQGREGRLLRRQAAARSAGRFRLRIGRRSIGLRHGSALLVEAPAEHQGASTPLSEMVVVERAGFNNQSAARLVELRFYLSESVRQECTRLNWIEVHRAI